MTVLDIYGHIGDGVLEDKPVAVRHDPAPAAERLDEEFASDLASEQVWELPIGYALATAAAAWIVHALLMRYALVSGGWAIVWPLNGVTAGLMLGKKRRDWLVILSFVSLATTMHEGTVTGHWFTAVVDSFLNAVEVLIVLAILPPYEDLQQWLRAPQLTSRFTFASFLAAPVVSGLLSAIYYHYTWHLGFWHLFHQWALADALGLGSTLPLVLALRSPASWSVRHPSRLIRPILMLGTLGATTFLVFSRLQLSLEFVLFPALALTIFFSGFTSAMLAIELICCVAAYELLHRHGAPALLNSHTSDVLFLQLFLGLIVPLGFASAVLLAERKLFTVRYRSTERQYRLLAECSRDVIVLTNLEGMCRFVSPASLEVLGFDPEELQGQPFQRGIHEEDVAQCNSLLHDIRLNLATSGVLTYRTTTRDGRNIWVEGRVRATTDEVGDVTGAILTLRDITEVKRLQKELIEVSKQLEHQAAFDAQTNVANRRRFDDIFDQEWRRAAREFQPLALLLIDIDHFEDYCDSNGRAAGDACLRSVAQAMTASARRPGDLVARWEGEQFAVLLPTTDLHGACEVAEKVRLAVAQMKLPYGDAEGGTLTISIGAAAAIPLPDMVPAMLVEDADRALFLAKANGRNRVEYKPGPRPVRASSNTISFA